MGIKGRITVALVSVITAIVIEIARDIIRERRRRKIREEYLTARGWVEKGE